MSIIEQVKECFQDCAVGTEFTRIEIINRVYRKYGTTPKSVILSDYCYNITNKGKQASKSLENFNIFLWIQKGIYQYVGDHYKPE